MNREKYLNKREALLNEAKALIEDSKIEEAEAKKNEIEKLDADFEASATAMANLRAMEGAPVADPFGAIADSISMGPADDSEATYRNAFLKNLMGRDLNEAERVAFTSAEESGGAVIPTQTASEIIRKLKERAPLLSEITLLHVEGNVKFAVEGAIADAELHEESATINADADTLVEVNLGGYEITKLIQVSDTVSTMSIDAFEGWLTDMIVETVADKISALIINGTGTGQPAGLEKANTWGSGNSVSVGKSASLTAANVQALIGLLGGGYDPNAKFVMSKKTLFTDFMPLQDNAKHDIVTREGRNYFVYGYPVLIDSRVKEHEAYLGDLKKYVANLSEAVQVKTDYDINTNSNKYLGVAMFDGKMALGEALVKLVKAAG